MQSTWPVISRRSQSQCHQSPGENKRKEVELGSHSCMDCPAAELFLSSRFTDSGFVALLRTAVERAVSEVHKSLRNGWVPSSLTPLFWRWLTVSSVFTGSSARTSYSSVCLSVCLPLSLDSPSVSICLSVPLSFSVSVCLSLSLSVFVSVALSSVCLSVCLCLFLSVSVSVCLSVCLSSLSPRPPPPPNFSSL